MTYKEIEERFPGFRAYCRAQFIGNECDSDEYGETQPAKGLGMIADWAERTHLHEPNLGMLTYIRYWLDAVIEGGQARYAGAEQLRPVLGIYFDLLWETDEHPYGHEPELLLEWFQMDRET